MKKMISRVNSSYISIMLIVSVLFVFLNTATTIAAGIGDSYNRLEFEDGTYIPATVKGDNADGLFLSTSMGTYSGRGFLRGWNTGRSVTFPAFFSYVSGKKNIEIVYSYCTSISANMQISINQRTVDIVLPGTGGWAWKKQTVAVDFDQGLNNIVFTYTTASNPAQLFSLDYINIDKRYYGDDYAYGNLVLKDSNGAEISGLPTTGASISAEINFIKLDDTPTYFDTMMFLAFYKNDEMLMVCSNSKVLTNYLEQGKLTIPFTMPEGVTGISAYIVDGVNSIKPLVDFSLNRQR